MKSKFLRLFLVLVCLSGVQGCGEKAYFYTCRCAAEAGIALGPLMYSAQVTHHDGKKITIAVSLGRPYAEKYDEVRVEAACSEFEVLVEGKKLKPTQDLCPTGQQLPELGAGQWQSLKLIKADFPTPDGRPKAITVSLPAMKVTSVNPQQAAATLDKSSITFTLVEYTRGFGLH